jgi:hypothetical protein
MVDADPKALTPDRLVLKRFRVPVDELPMV